MRAVVISHPGPPDNLRVDTLPDPDPGPGEIAIEVVSAGVNRTDLTQRAGRYLRPLVEKESRLGLEISGHVSAIGEEASAFDIGQPVCALLPGGGYADQVCVDEALVMPVPESLDIVDAGGLPEAYLTAYDALILRAGMRLGWRILVHAGASGVGSAAIQLAVASGAQAAATCSGKKIRMVEEADASLVVDRQKQHFEDEILRWTDGRGVDLILDPVGGSYMMPNLRCLRRGGMLIMVSTLGGETSEIDVNYMQKKAASIVGTALRPRSLGEKAILIQQFTRDILPMVHKGGIYPRIDRIYPLKEAAQAHKYMEANLNQGKILLVAHRGYMGRIFKK